MTTATPTRPADAEQDQRHQPLLFYVYFDFWCGYRDAPEWELDNPPDWPPEPLAVALDHAADLRLRGFTPTKLAPA